MSLFCSTLIQNNDSMSCFQIIAQKITLYSTVANESSEYFFFLTNSLQPQKIVSGSKSTCFFNKHLLLLSNFSILQILIYFLPFFIYKYLINFRKYYSIQQFPKYYFEFIAIEKFEILSILIDCQSFLLNFFFSVDIKYLILFYQMIILFSLLTIKK